MPPVHAGAGKSIKIVADKKANPQKMRESNPCII
jgi:hypothetical protein